MHLSNKIELFLFFSGIPLDCNKHRRSIHGTKCNLMQVLKLPNSQKIAINFYFIFPAILAGALCNMLQLSLRQCLYHGIFLAKPQAGSVGGAGAASP